MRCPRCGFVGELVDGACPQCGYRRVSASDHLRNAGTPSARPPSAPLRGLSGPLSSPLIPPRPQSGSLRPFSLSTARSGDVLKRGRYRLIDQLVLPDNQRGQGAAWLASDDGAGQTQVVIREVVVPPEEQANKKQIVRQVVLRLSEVARHNGFPKILDVFDELDNYFIVFQYIDGESLASLLRRQGGALPERTVAEYGRQLCEMLTVLSWQPQSIAHGAISPETVIVSPDRSRVYLIHLPLFSPTEPANPGSVVAYKAPEQVLAASPSSDLYAVAATMHHAVTGFDPRERIAFFYPPARRLNPLVSQQMETILAQELRLAATQRYARASDMQMDIATLLATNVLAVGEKSGLPVTGPLKIDILEMRRESRKRSQRQLGIFGAICAVVLGIVLFAYFYPSLKSPGSTISPTFSATATATSLRNALDEEWQAEAPLFQSKGIGISDGRYVFDTYAGHPDVEVNDKKQAAQALLANNLTLALNDYNKAITSDQTDAEARIYDEDLQIETRKDPFVTVVLGLPLDGSTGNLAISRPDMQAAFVFQHRVNTQNPSPLPGGMKLRILIANSGSDDGNVAAVAHFIAKRVQIGNLDHIIAVVGWPKSEESTDASSVLTTAKIPMITQTASSASLSGSSSYFFRVNPDDTAQGKTQGQFAYQVLGARNVLVLRERNDSYSQSLANAFIASFQQLGGKLSGNQVADYFTEGQTTVEQFRQQAVQDAIMNHVDLIFLPGFDVDAVRLARALGEEEGIYGWSAYLANLKILGGNGFDTGLILGQGVGPDATLAQNFPQDMQRLLFTSFANRAEGGAQLQGFLQDWTRLYGTAAANNSNPSLPVTTAIMVDDAFGVLTYAIGLVNGPLTGENLRSALATIGTGNNKPYDGLSGQISFDREGNPINKTVVLLSVAANSSTGQNEIKFLSKSN